MVKCSASPELCPFATWEAVPGKGGAPPDSKLVNRAPYANGGGVTAMVNRGQPLHKLWVPVRRGDACQQGRVFPGLNSI